MKKMFSETGRWYKGNLHSHTTNSDGKLKPEEAVTLYKKYGYHFLCLSEHDHFTDLSAQFDSPEFIILPGLEASAYLFNKEKTGVLKTHHIHGILGNEAMQQAAGAQIFHHGERLEPLVFTEESCSGTEIKRYPARQGLFYHVQSSKLVQSRDGGRSRLKGCMGSGDLQLWNGS